MTEGCELMKIRWYRRFLFSALLTVLIIGGGYAAQLYNEAAEKQEVSTKTVSENMVIPGGMPVGIYMETDGVMVLGTDKIKAADGLNYEPAYHLVKEGDYIVGINQDGIDCKKDLLKSVSALTGEDAILHLRRGKEYIDIKVKPVLCENRSYKLGIWVRDNAQGLGTITFLTGNSEFGALGHGIHDTDTSGLLQISQGTLYETSIRDIKKGTSGEPGGMEGIIVYNKYNILGNITKNTDAGIYGTIDKIDALFADQTPMEVAGKEEIKEGEATIRCCVDGTVRDYKILITKIDLSPKEINKGIIIQVNDPELLQITGGIVQGMSGSPIIQNNKIVGAVTHVFVQDSTKGYGIFIENMLENVK